MYENGTVYAVTEENVDGCGGDATEYVAAEGPMSPGEIDDLRRTLVETKLAAAGKDWDTSDMVDHAVELFNGSHATRLRRVSDPVAGRIHF